MGQITTTQNLVAIKEVRHAGQLSRESIQSSIILYNVVWQLCPFPNPDKNFKNISSKSGDIWLE